jgi:hypothetical protein
MTNDEIAGLVSRINELEKKATPGEFCEDVSEAECEHYEALRNAWPQIAQALSSLSEARKAAEANRVSIHGMYDCHLFHAVEGSTVAEVIGNWRLHNQQFQPAIVGGKEVKDLGPSGLCQIIVLSGEKELRRVGPMVFSRGPRLAGQCDEKALQEWRDAALADPDIPRLLAERAALSREGERERK